MANTRFRLFVCVETGYVGISRDVLQLSPLRAFNQLGASSINCCILLRVILFCILDIHMLTLNSVMILAVIAGFGRTIMEALIGSTIVDATEHRGPPIAGFYASNIIIFTRNMMLPTRNSVFLIIILQRTKYNYILFLLFLLGEGAYGRCFSDGECQNDMGVTSNYCCGGKGAGSYSLYSSGELSRCCHKWLVLLIIWASIQ